MQGKEIKIEKEIAFESEILKTDERKRLVYGVVLIPDDPDLQGDVVSKETIEEAAHDFVMNGLVLKTRHKDEAPVTVKVVESFIVPEGNVVKFGNNEIPSGSWVLVTKVLDDGIWNKIKSGEISAYSVGGVGIRTPIED